jgi:predicted nucleic acid-binding protein
MVAPSPQLSQSPPSVQAVIIDTSAWISRLLPTDSNHAAARKWIDQHLLSGGLLVAPVLFVTEVAAAISRQTGRPVLARRAVTQLYNLPQMSLVPIDQALVEIATNLAANLGIRGADALFVALAQQLNIPLVTFDTEQIQKPIETIQTIRP